MDAIGAQNPNRIPSFSQGLPGNSREVRDRSVNGDKHQRFPLASILLKSSLKPKWPVEYGWQRPAGFVCCGPRNWYATNYNYRRERLYGIDSAAHISAADDQFCGFRGLSGQPALFRLRG